VVQYGDAPALAGSRRATDPRHRTLRDLVIGDESRRIARHRVGKSSGGGSGTVPCGRAR